MNKLLLAVSVFTFGLAHAQSGKSEKPATPPSGAAATGAPPMMEMPKPGPEQEALKPFVKNSTSTGTHVMDGKEMATKGKASCKWLSGNMWAACDIEDTSGTGKTAMKWMGHLVFGYDLASKGYRAVMTDNMGMIARMKGTLEGSKMVWESMDEMKVPGMPSKERITEDATDPKNGKLTFEGMINGKWTPTGTATVKYSGGK